MTRKPQFALAIALLAVACSSARYESADEVPHRGAEDLAITSRIRQTLLEPNALSLSAKNVTIVTDRGQVTLYGLVESEAERREVANIAREFAGSARVRENLEIWPD